MTGSGYILLIFALIHTAAWGTFVYRPSGLAQLLVMLLWLVWFIFLVCVSKFRRTRRGGISASYALPILFLVAPFIGGFIGGRLRNAVFRSRLPDYEAAVHAILQGAQPTRIPRLAYAITPTNSPAGDPEVFFFWGGGFPVKHTAFLYSAADPHADPKLIRDWRGIHPLAPNWYLVAD